MDLVSGICKFNAYQVLPFPSVKPDDPDVNGLGPRAVWYLSLSSLGSGLKPQIKRARDAPLARRLGHKVEPNGPMWPWVFMMVFPNFPDFRGAFGALLAQNKRPQKSGRPWAKEVRQLVGSCKLLWCKNHAKTMQKPPSGRPSEKDVLSPAGRSESAARVRCLGARSDLHGAIAGFANFWSLLAFGYYFFKTFSLTTYVNDRPLGVFYVIFFYKQTQAIKI